MSYAYDRDYETRQGRDIVSEVEELDQAITDLARVTLHQGIQHEMGREYLPVLQHLVAARTTLRRVYGKV